MKRAVITAAVCLAVVGAVLAVSFNPDGSVVTATTTEARLTFSPSLKVLSVYNSGSVRAFVRPNTALADWDSDTAIPVEAGTVFSFNYGLQESIGDVVYATTNSSTTLVFGGY